MSTLKLGDKAPNFDAETSEGKINFYEYLGDSWGILFSHPADYTPVCTTELGTAAKYKEDFDPLLLRMEENKIQYQLLNEKPDLFTFLV